MLRVIRALEHSLSSTSSPELARQRADAIQTLPSTAERLAAMSLHRLVVARPEAAKKIANTLLNGTGLQLIGGGAETGVYKKGDEVVKVVHGSARLSEAQKEAESVRRNDHYAQLAEIFGDFVLEQSTIVAPHPLEPRWRVVQTIQPYLEFDKLPLVIPDGPAATEAAAKQALTLRPTLKTSLTDFIDATNAYLRYTGNYPDINGNQNLVIGQLGANSELVLLDTMPIEPSFQAGQLLMAEQKQSLEKALAA